MRVPVTLDGDRIEATVQGPENVFLEASRRCSCRCASRSIARRGRSTPTSEACASISSRAD